MKRNPDCLIIEMGNLIYAPKGKETLIIPLKTIQKVVFKPKGIGLILDPERRAKIHILDSKYKVSQLTRQSRMRRFDLFFEWFELPVKEHLEKAIQTVRQEGRFSCTRS